MPDCFEYHIDPFSRQPIGHLYIVGHCVRSEKKLSLGTRIWLIATYGLTASPERKNSLIRHDRRPRKDANLSL